VHPAERIRGTKSSKLRGKTVVLAVTGSIAAVETVKLARELIRHGADVHPVMSDGAHAIVHPNALEFATGRAPVTRLTGDMSYIDLCGTEGRADLLLVAPCTANTIGKMAAGIDDTPVTTFATLALGTGLPVVVAPAMHEPMYDQPLVAANVKRLEDLGVAFVPPLREEDKAKLAPIEAVVARVIRCLGPRDLAGKRVVVIGGATAEAVDDVRVLTNRATGVTAVELAKVAYERGADVELWIGRHETVLPPYLTIRPFETVHDLLAMARELACDVCVVPAAISDYTLPKAEGKISSDREELVLRLDPAPKVLEAIRAAGRCVLVAFKAEAKVPPAELERRARKRLARGDVDFVVANDVTQVTRDRTSVLILDKKGRVDAFEGPKALAAERIWSAVVHGLPG
jgi:phosphopantothenoylcysteine decarboxylase/phosphopantothenate--cysteine ligase